MKGEFGVSDLEGLSSKTLSWSIKLAAESVDRVDGFECGFGRGEGVFVIEFRDLNAMEGPAGTCSGGLGSRRELIRLEDDISVIEYTRRLTVSERQDEKLLPVIIFCSYQLFQKYFHEAE